MAPSIYFRDPDKNTTGINQINQIFPEIFFRLHFALTKQKPCNSSTHKTVNIYSYLIVPMRESSSIHPHRNIHNFRLPLISVPLIFRSLSKKSHISPPLSFQTDKHFKTKFPNSPKFDSLFFLSPSILRALHSLPPIYVPTLRLKMN